MRTVRAFLIAFSMYSRIPVPQTEWRDEDMKLALCFFPWVGAVIGAFVYLWGAVCMRFGIGDLCRAAGCAAIPLLITGGIHADGFMDTSDAFCSFRPGKEKLEILKDPHIGACSVIMFAVCGLIFLGAFSEIRDPKLLGTVCAGFVLSRCLSGIGAVSLPPAKEDGLLRFFADRAQKNTVRGLLILQGALCAGSMLWLSPRAGLAVIAAALCAFAYCGSRCMRELGGITGDTAGWFVLVCECGMAAAAAAVGILG